MVAVAVAAAEEGAERSRLPVELGRMAAVGSLVGLESAEVPGNCCTY